MDEVLWEGLKQGDVVALGKLYDSYIETLFDHGIKISSDRTYVMDCIHDLFLDLYKYRTRIAKTDNVKFYLLKSLKRKINRKYSSKLVPVTNEYISDNNSLSYSTSHEEDIISSEYAYEKTLKLTKALDFLTKTQKKGLFLRFTEDMPYEEIAEIMEVSVQTSRTIIYRGIKVLRQNIAILSSLFMFAFFA